MQTTQTTLSKRKLYQGAYRADLETPIEEPEENTSSQDPEPKTAEENVWKKRYGDLRTHQNHLTEEVKSLKLQLIAAQKKEIQIPSSKEEIDAFSQRYPDVFRHIRSIAMQEILSQKKDLELETQVVQENLEKLTREAAKKKILNAHPDFDDLNASEEFHDWAKGQSKAIQNMLYESPDPDDCIAAIDLYKAHKKPVQTKPRSNGADTLVKTRTPVETADNSGKRIWKASEIGTMHPKQFEKLEAEIERAREEGRIDMNA